MDKLGRVIKDVLIAVGLCILTAAAVGAQPPAGRGSEDAAVTPAELRRMFDAYALMQAQEQLKIDDDHYSQFLARFKGLQDVRRRLAVERARTIMELRRLGNDPQSDEGQLRDRLKALQDLEVRAAAEIRKAYDAVDQILDVRQQAKFRAFEEQMERRQLELISRARQANRAKKQQ
jgi:Spy/CpxP family protein refolding chaperone